MPSPEMFGSGVGGSRRPSDLGQGTAVLAQRGAGYDGHDFRPQFTGHETQVRCR
ncbi:MAG: hypothetical protein RMJ82_10660 [Gemmatales bacterium]|nr:hypothetical protein [Gemmatales bacterium]